jgi:hypothetical protein
MKTIILALLGGLIMLGGAGIAQAADGTPADAQSKADPVSMAMPNAQREATTITTNNSKDRKLVALTDEQMGSVTAGDYRGYWHTHWNWPYWPGCGYLSCRPHY